MKKMANLIIGIILLILGYLVLLDFFKTSTNHYSVDVVVNDEIKTTLLFSTINNNPLTTEFLKNKFDYMSNDKVIITNIKSITRDEKMEKCK